MLTAYTNKEHTVDTVETVALAIRNMNQAQLDRVVAAIKQQRTWLARRSAADIRIGDTVSFAARGQQVLGTVTKVNVKTALVRQHNSNTTWRVHASLLTKTVAA
jgi:hypothetical protein